MIQHVALIMDGNRRWAKAKKLPTFAGHQKGYQQIEKIVTRAQEFGISHITLWAFSTENWKRSEEEVSYLMDLFRKVFHGTMLKNLLKKGGRIKVLGNIKAFPEDIQKDIAEVIEKSKDNTSIQINIALNYGGREEILWAVNKILEEYNSSVIPAKAGIQKKSGSRIKHALDSDRVSGMTNFIDEEMFASYLYTASQPDPDLIIRTGGAMRLSGYLPWQGVYSELYFTDTFWPDFDEKEFDKAIEEYEKRERRFGK